MADTMRIHLTDRPPIEINQGAWPIIAQAYDSFYDPSFFKFDTMADWFVAVRRHSNGQALIYGWHQYIPRRKEPYPNITIAAGTLLEGRPSVIEIVAEILNVGDQLKEQVLRAGGVERPRQRIGVVVDRCVKMVFEKLQEGRPRD